MADVSSTFSSISSTESSNSPAGSTNVGTGLDDNVRMVQALMAAWRDQSAWGILTLTSVAGTNTITATLAASGSVTFGPTSYITGSKWLLVPANTNTGATTLNITSPNGGSALTAKNVFAGGAALVGGELKSGFVYLLEYDGTQFNVIGGVGRQPTRQILTSGSGATYTTPTGCTRIFVRMVGGGGGGGAATTNSGTAGGNTTFSTLTAGGGGAGGQAGTSSAGGTASGGDVNAPGAPGGSGGNNLSSVVIGGGHGGSSYFGGGGAGGFGGAGAAAVANSGGGGGGGGTSSASCGGGGASGAYCEKLITAPSATYTYTVGALGSGGSAGGLAGGNGGSGLIVVDEFYN